MKHRLLSLMLVIALCLSLLPVSALALEIANLEVIQNAVEAVEAENVEAAEPVEETEENSTEEDAVVEGMEEAPVLESSGDVAISEKNFPDANFRAYVSEELDDGDGILTSAEIAAVTTIDCASRGICSLEGIEIFVGLEILNCAGNDLTSLKIANKHLVELNCTESMELVEIDVSGCVMLEVLRCIDSGVKNLNLGGCKYLRYLECNASELTELDVSDSPILSYLRFEGEERSDYGQDRCFTIEGDSTMMLHIDEDLAEASYYPLIDLADVEINPTNFPDANFRSYVSENFDGNGDGVLAYAEILDVKRIECNSMGIKSLEGSEVFQNLISLECDYNELEELNVTEFEKLEWMSCDSNNLTELDMTSCTGLKTLSCSFNGIRELNLSNCSKLEKLYCYYNQLEELDLSNCKVLNYIACFDNNLVVLNIYDCVSLETLSCERNGLRELNIHNCTKLELLTCAQNELMCLDISNCPALLDWLANGEKEIDEENGTISYGKLEEDWWSGEGGLYLMPYLTYDLDVALLNGIPDATELASAMKYTVTNGNGSDGASYDYNADGVVDILDIIRLVRYLAGEEVELN